MIVEIIEYSGDSKNHGESPAVAGYAPDTAKFELYFNAAVAEICDVRSGNKAYWQSSFSVLLSDLTDVPLIAYYHTSKNTISLHLCAGLLHFLVLLFKNLEDIKRVGL